MRLNALSAGLSPGSKKRLEAQAKIGTHSRFVRPCQASALLTWYTSDLWYTSLICAKAKMMDLTGNGNITTAKRARKPLKNPNKKTSTQCTGQLASKRWKALRAAPPETKAKNNTLSKGKHKQPTLNHTILHMGHSTCTHGASITWPSGP